MNQDGDARVAWQNRMGCAPISGLLMPEIPSSSKPRLQQLSKPESKKTDKLI
jgi:hypothetical protein